MTRLFSTLAFLLALISSHAYGQNVLITELAKVTDKEWRVTYKSLTPVNSITFAITLDDSRSKRWLISDSQFELIHLSGRDIVTRKDNQLFSEVSFTLTPSYIHLPKYYSPFSRFSDGGILVHSARFFACPNLCTGFENAWYFELTVNPNERIILNGQQHQGRVRWWDKNDGTKIYVGNNAITEHPSFYSIIDQGLDEKLQGLLLEFFPKMMAHLSQKFSPLATKPMLFASFERIDDGRRGRQGGVLPNQVFMHWYGKEQRIKNRYEVLWFYAHEAAHLYQGEHKQFSGDQSLAWIHEGHADMLAHELLATLLPETSSYLNKRRIQAEQRCQAAISMDPLATLAQQGRYDALYDCGFSFYWFIKQKSDNDELAYVFWSNFVSNLESANKLDIDVFLMTAKPFLNERDYLALTKKVTN